MIFLLHDLRAFVVEYSFFVRAAAGFRGGWVYQLLLPNIFAPNVMALRRHGRGIDRSGPVALSRGSSMLGEMTGNVIFAKPMIQIASGVVSYPHNLDSIQFR
jgi:hypothetical protein